MDDEDVRVRRTLEGWMRADLRHLNRARGMLESVRRADGGVLAREQGFRGSAEAREFWADKVDFWTEAHRESAEELAGFDAREAAYRARVDR